MTKATEPYRRIAAELKRLEAHAEIIRQIEEKMQTEPPHRPQLYAYRRVSHLDSFRSGLGLEEQIASVEQWAQLVLTKDKDLHWDPKTNWFPEPKPISASKVRFLDRPAGKKLHLALRPGDHVVFAVLSRGFRNIRDFLRTKDVFDALGVMMHFADLRVDMQTASGQFMVHILAAAEQWYAQLASERNKASAARRKARLEAWNHPTILWRHYGPKGNRRRVQDLKQREMASYVIYLRDEVGLNWVNIGDHLEALQAEQEGRKPRPRGFHNWSRYHRVQRYYHQELALREEEDRKKAEWQATGHITPTHQPLSDVEPASSGRNGDSPARPADRGQRG